MKRTTKISLTAATAIAISIGMMPTLPARAADGQITCDRLIKNNGYSVVTSGGGDPVRRNGQVVGYSYFYRIQHRRYGGVRNVDCFWSQRRDRARLIYR